MARGCFRCDFCIYEQNKLFCNISNQFVVNENRCEKFLPKGFRENEKREYIESVIDNKNRRNAYFGLDEWEETAEETRYWNNWR